MEALKLFISYAHEDEPYRAALESICSSSSCKASSSTGRLEDHAGSGWEGEINANLEEARVIVCW
jgi:hypothetical protein